MLQVSNRRVCSYLRILPNTKINLSSSLRKARVPFGWNYPRLGFSRSRYATNFCRCFSNIRYWSSWAGKNRSLLPLEMLRLDAYGHRMCIPLGPSTLLCFRRAYTSTSCYLYLFLCTRNVQWSGVHLLHCLRSHSNSFSHVLTIFMFGSFLVSLYCTSRARWFLTWIPKATNVASLPSSNILCVPRNTFNYPFSGLFN